MPGCPGGGDLHERDMVLAVLGHGGKAEIGKAESRNGLRDYGLRDYRTADCREEIGERR